MFRVSSAACLLDISALPMQVATNGYIPPVLPGGNCFPESAGTGFDFSAATAGVGAATAGLRDALSGGMSKVGPALDGLTSKMGGLTQGLTAGVGGLSSKMGGLTEGLSSKMDQLAAQAGSSGADVAAAAKQQLEGVALSLQEGQVEMEQSIQTSVSQVLELKQQAMAGASEVLLTAAALTHVQEGATLATANAALLQEQLAGSMASLQGLLQQLAGAQALLTSQLLAAVQATAEHSSSAAVSEVHELFSSAAQGLASAQSEVWVRYEDLALADKLTFAVDATREGARHAVNAVDQVNLPARMLALEASVGSAAGGLLAAAADQAHALQLDSSMVAAAEAFQSNAATAVDHMAALAAMGGPGAAELGALQAHLLSLSSSVGDVLAAAQGSLSAATSGLTASDAALQSLQASVSASARMVSALTESNLDQVNGLLQQLEASASDLQRLL
jgi:hypothetical protein